MLLSILITTKDRKDDLIFTLEKINHLIDYQSVDCVVYDDGSSDGTYDFIVKNYPKIKVLKNSVSKGLIYCRNKMLNETKATYAISLDDDAHFVTEFPMSGIIKHFEDNQNCGVIALRIFWGKVLPDSIISSEMPQRVQGFVGCGHVWRIDAWRQIPNYPAWFIFYGEENFASYHLFKKNWEIHYLPGIFVQHRVDIKSRKKNSDYTLRLRRSLRSGWYLFSLFYPIKMIPRQLAYSIWIQFKIKVFKGDFKALLALFLALFDFILAMPKIIKNSSRFTAEELSNYQKIEATKIYWNP